MFGSSKINIDDKLICTEDEGVMQLPMRSSHLAAIARKLPGSYDGQGITFSESQTIVLEVLGKQVVVQDVYRIETSPGTKPLKYHSQRAPTVNKDSNIITIHGLRYTGKKRKAEFELDYEEDDDNEF